MKSTIGNEDMIMEEVGRRLGRKRIDLGLTQAELAKRAGVGKRTLERMEAGGSTQMGGFLRVVRELELLEDFMGWLPDAGPRPMDLLKLKGKERQRASPKKKRNVISEQAPENVWTWGEDT